MKNFFALLILTSALQLHAGELQFGGARLVCINETQGSDKPILDVSVLPNGTTVIIHNTKKPTGDPLEFIGNLDAVEFNGTAAAAGIKLRLVRLTGMLEMVRLKNSDKWIGRCAPAPVF